MEHNHEFEGGHEHRHDHDHGPEHSKYEEALAKYNIRLRDEDVKAKNCPTHRKTCSRKQYTGRKEIPVPLH